MKIKNWNYVCCSAIVFCLISCAPRVAIKKGFDFTKIKTIGIGEITPEGPGSEIVKDEFTREFILMGYNVKRSIKDVDIILSGAITEYSPSKKYLMFIGDNGTTAQTQVIVTQPVMEISGSNVYSLGTAFGLGTKGQIVVSNATAGVTVRLIDPIQNEVVWTYSYSYEGLDIQTAVSSVVSYIVKTFVYTAYPKIKK